MSVESKRPQVIAFDGLHRTGKGTQCELLQKSIDDLGGKSVVVRGDGTRDGIGLHPGDPYSPEWQDRSIRVKSPAGNTVESWNASAFILSKELADIVKNNPENYDVVIVDRSLLSRAAFLLHRGVGMTGVRFTLDGMYPHRAGNIEELDYENMVPDTIFDLQVNSPKTLLNRLDTKDPKYVFRSRNIKGGFGPAKIASRHLPQNIEDRVVRIDANESPEVVHREVLKNLGGIAIAPRLF